MDNNGFSEVLHTDPINREFMEFSVLIRDADQYSNLIGIESRYRRFSEAIRARVEGATPTGWCPTEGLIEAGLADIARRGYNKGPNARCSTMTDQSSNTRRIVAAPAPSHPDLRSTVLNVYCAEDEDVEWQWTETVDGRYVSGYRLVPRKKSA